MTAPNLDEHAVAFFAAAVFKDILSRDPDASILGAIVSQQPKSIEGERSSRDETLDTLHAQIEGTPHPNKPVIVSLYPPRGKLITYQLDSLRKRKNRTPSERERRWLLGIELADFLTAGGL